MTKILTLRIDEDLLKKLDKLVEEKRKEREGITRSDLIREAIERLLSPTSFSPSFSHPYYDPLINQLLERISKLEAQVQMLIARGTTPVQVSDRPGHPSSAQHKEVVIERTVTKARILGDVKDMKDLLDNPWAEILKKKGKGRGRI
ncbi:MAG: hypothetical protein DRO00_06130 [Thermoproteota archaeon]|nr:MAG: hypothetical protein DRO00_06130 [Candidatus Korarchaeota archaeon]